MPVADRYAGKINMNQTLLVELFTEELPPKRWQNSAKRLPLASSTA
jgi:glycyl-tRNA synthetase beta subunit